MASVSIAIALALQAACDGDASPDVLEPTAVAQTPVESTPAASPSPAPTVTAAGTQIAIGVEIADSPEERTTGLMGRSELAPDSGMLFVIEPPGRGFWMRNTTLPLTVAFIGACGEIVDFADLEPLSEEIKNTDRPYSFALEMEQGWFEENGIAAGDVLELPPGLLPAGCDP
jgi:uncharacterized membrane protein (UPF0127 family)